jgi:hypothetical protein
VVLDVPSKQVCKLACFRIQNFCLQDQIRTLVDGQTRERPRDAGVTARRV